MEVAVFTFNDFQENTYVLYDETGECMVVDPGIHNEIEQIQFSEFLIARELTPKVLFNTHCHLDHVFGNQFVADKYGLKLMAHKGEQIVLDYVPKMCDMYGIHYKGSPNIELYVEEGETIAFGNQKLTALLTPGHSPASLSLYNPTSHIVIAGDVLFKGSIGRTDLPGGDFDTLISSVREKLFTLPDDTVVYPGHGPSTTVGEEKRSNPFFQEST